MNLYRRVLGGTDAVYMFSAVIIGLLFTAERLGKGSADLAALQVHALTAALVALFLFLIRREVDDLVNALVKAGLAIGLYKIVQTFLPLSTAWRAEKVTVVNQGEVARNG